LRGNMSMGRKGLANDTLCVQTRRHSRGVVDSSYMLIGQNN
jgi:hypothetical protein